MSQFNLLGSRRFAPFFWTQALGAFNDNAFRNALIPTTTYIGLLIGGFLSGAVLTETIFNWNGIGQYTVSAIYASDYPALQGVVLIEAFVYATANLIVDLAYGVIDPRVRIS